MYELRGQYVCLATKLPKNMLFGYLSHGDLKFA